ncbi:hypothetical protein PMAYCL1PPCAC_32410, partial [Pristionchus mayeri]
ISCIVLPCNFCSFFPKQLIARFIRIYSMLLFTLLLLAPFADTYVRLQNSILYDEQDFAGVNEISTNICAKGCKAYATIVRNADNLRLTQNIHVFDPNTREDFSVAYLSTLYLQGTDNEKAYLEMGNAPLITISNKNLHLESAPLALWIVSTESPYFRDAEVYDPLQFRRRKGPAPGPIMILSASPFTLTMQPEDENAILARTTGFDAIDRNNVDGCYTALDTDFSDGFGGLTLAINGPLFTLLFDTAKYPNANVEISGNTEFDFDRYPTPNKPVFISSAGFVCGSFSSSQVYRSSELKKNPEYTLRTPNNKEMRISFDIDVVSDLQHPVTIFDLVSQTDLGFYGNFKDKTNSVQLSMATSRVSVTFTPGPSDSFFGMRVSADEMEKSTTKTTTTMENDQKRSTMTSSTIVVTTSSAAFRRFMLSMLLVIALRSK